MGHAWKGETSRHAAVRTGNSLGAERGFLQDRALAGELAADSIAFAV